ncbi:MAG: FG-GAP-like repeat-containing protein [Planctomycetota bacterium]
MKTIRSLAVALLIVANSALAQQFSESLKQHLPTSAFVGVTVALATGDVDGDGDIDLVVGSATVSQSLYLDNGEGEGVYVDATATRLSLPGSVSALALVDFDLDSDLDLVSSSTVINEMNRAFVNDGAGRFTEESVDAARLSCAGIRMQGAARCVMAFRPGQGTTTPARNCSWSCEPKLLALLALQRRAQRRDPCPERLGARAVVVAEPLQECRGPDAVQQLELLIELHAA